MIQHYKEKNIVDIEKLVKELKEEEINHKFENSLFLNYGFSKETIMNGLVFERCTFSKLSFTDVILKNIQFNHCIFIDCYFNKTTFDLVGFENVSFINCSLNKMKINNTKFFYTEWENTYIKYDEIKTSLPVEHNMRKRLCKVMAKNCLSDGNVEGYKQYFFESKRAGEREYISRILRKDEYYKKHFNPYDSIKSVVKLGLSKINWLVWGYGERIINVFISSAFIILLFAIIYLFNPEISKLESHKFVSAMYLSICSFVTMSPASSFEVQSTDFIFRYFVALEGLIGVAFMGVFTAALFRNVNSR